MYCTNCSNEVSEKAIACPKCGVPPLVERKFCYNCGGEHDPQQVTCVKCGVGTLAGKKKNKTASGLFAILLGFLGVHKFYHGSWGWGILYVLFFWTYIPTISGIIEGIRYLAMDEMKYHLKYSSPSHPFKW